MLQFDLPKLDSTQTYELEVYARGEAIKQHGDGKMVGAICVEYFKNGKWHSGYYHKAKTLGAEWEKLTLPVTTKPGTDVVIKLYMRRGFTGKIWFDDLIFRTSGTADSIVLNEPKMLSINTENGKLALSTSPGMPESAKLLLELENGGKTRTLLLDGQARIYQGNAGKLVPGPVKLTATAADTVKRKKLYTETFHLTAARLNLLLPTPVFWKKTAAHSSAASHSCRSASTASPPMRISRRSLMQGSTH